MKTYFNPKTGEYTEFQDSLFCSAFSESGFDPTGSGSKGAPIIGAYNSTADTLATILANGYLDGYATALKNNQLLWLTGTDGEMIGKLTVSGTTDVAIRGANLDATGIIETIASTGSTGTDLAQTGVSLFTSTYAGTYNLPPVRPGQGSKFLVMNTTSAIVVTTTAGDFDFSGSNVITFNGRDQTVELMPLPSTSSTTQWFLRNIQEVPSTAAVSTVLS